MKSVLCITAAASFALFGCVSMPVRTLPPSTAPAIAATKETVQKPAVIVSGDQISEQNAWQMANHLKEEMEREAQGDLPIPDKKNQK